LEKRLRRQQSKEIIEAPGQKAAFVPVMARRQLMGKTDASWSTGGT